MVCPDETSVVRASTSRKWKQAPPPSLLAKAANVNTIESIQDYAKRLGKYRAKLKHQILAFVEEAEASPAPAYYLNQLGHAVFITWRIIDSTQYVGTKADYQKVADELVELWCKPINLDMLMAISTTLQRARDQRMARLLGDVPQADE